jgi:hypothetical protein
MVRTLKSAKRAQPFSTSRPTAHSDSPSDSSTSNPVLSCAKSRQLTLAMDRQCELADAVGQNAFDVTLPKASR